jgi:hypothetical protein
MKMWRGKKLILVAVLASAVLIGSIGGVVAAQTGNGDDNQPQAQQEALLEKVCAIYEQNTGVTIDAEELQKALGQARDEMQSEALDKFLQNLVDEGKITQEQADQYQAWLEAKPDIGIPIAPGLGGRDMQHGFGGPGNGFPGLGEPQPTE